MNSELQQAIDKLLQLEKDLEKARSAFGSQYLVVSKLLQCPVCPSDASLLHNFGNYEIKCGNCGFHVGQSAELKEMLERWTAVCDVIEKMKKEEVRDYE